MENQAGHAFRINKITEIELSLRKEITQRDELSKRYYKSFKWFDNLEIILLVLSMGLGTTGVCLLSTIQAINSVVAIESIAIGINVLSIIGKYSRQKFSLKAQKHEKIKVLAEAKLNSISDLVSKALADNHISDQEFSIVISEFNSFQEMKNDIITKMRSLISNTTTEIKTKLATTPLENETV